MDYNTIKKLDEDSSKDLQEAKGPADECICNIFSTPEPEPSEKGVKASIKKAFGAIGKLGKGGGGGSGAKSVTIPLGRLAPNFIKSTRRRIIRKKGECGKCGCENEKIYMKDSDLTIKITTPDIDLDAICPCKQNCMPDKAKLKDNIKVTIEHAEAPATESIWNQQSIENNTKDNQSNEIANPIMTNDNEVAFQRSSKTDKNDTVIEVTKSVAMYNNDVNDAENKGSLNTLQKVASVVEENENVSINSNADEASDVMILVDDDQYERLFKTRGFSKDILSHVFRNPDTS